MLLMNVMAIKSVVYIATKASNALLFTCISMTFTQFLLPVNQIFTGIIRFKAYTGVCLLFVLILR